MRGCGDVCAGCIVDAGAMDGTSFLLSLKEDRNLVVETKKLLCGMWRSDAQLYIRQNANHGHSGVHTASRWLVLSHLPRWNALRRSIVLVYLLMMSTERVYLVLPLQNMCVQSLSSEPEKADANNVSSPPQHASDTSSLSCRVLSIDQKVCSSDDSIQGSVSVEHATVQLCDH